MINVISSGLYTSFQDLGRFGYRKFGVPVSGAMDSYSAKLANHLVGNNEGEAVMEITLTGPVLRFDMDMEIAITGAGFSPTLNNIEIPLNTRIFVPSNGLLKFGLASYGLRAYLAIAGGYRLNEYLGSKSFYQGITPTWIIRKEESFAANKPNTKGRRTSASVKEDISQFMSSRIQVSKGPEYQKLSLLQKEIIFETSFKIEGESNRMAYILGHSESISLPEIITAPVQPGTVQLTPSGKLLALMRDAQTTGGYSRILQLSERAIDRLSQKRTGEMVRFEII